VCLLAMRAHDTKVRLLLDYPSTLPQLLLGDGFRIKQVITNLLNNGLKFTPEGGLVVLRVSACEGSMEKSRANSILFQFEVEDSGVGISQEKLAKLFNLYEQLSVSHRCDGSGMGLYLSRQLVQLMDGKIGVNSVPRKGSTFWFTLPLNLQEDVPSCTPIARLNHDRSKCDHYRILLLDNDDRHTCMLRGELARWGFKHVVSTSSIEEAIRAIETVRMGIYVLLGQKMLNTIYFL